MNNKGILQIDELRLVARPYFQVVTTFILILGILGGWAGTEWLTITIISVVMIATVMWIGRDARIQGAGSLHVYASAVINLTATSIVVLITGGAYSPFWLLFFIGAVTSGMSLRGKAGTFLERLNAGVATLVLLGSELINSPLDRQSISLAGMEVLTLFGSSIMIRNITTLILESRDKLADSEERYRTLFDTARDVIVTLAPDGRIITLNPAFETFTGWSSDEWLGRTFDDLLAEEDRSGALELFNRILQGETLRAFRLKVRAHSGEVLVVEFNLSPQYRDDQVVGVLGIARNMTEEQREEDILRTSEERFRALIENISDAISLVSIDGTILYESQSVYRVLGYSPEELTGRNIFELLHPDDLSRIRSLFAQIIQDPGMTITAVAQYRHKNGIWRWVEGTGSNLLNEPGVQAIVVNYRDITEQKQAEEQTRRHVETVTALYETTRDLVVEHDLPKLLQIIVERATRILDAEGGGLYLCEPEKGQVRCVVSYNTPRDFTGTVLKYGEGAAGRVAQTGEPLVIDDYSTWDGRAQTYEEEKPFRSVLSVPMKWQDELIGIIHVLNFGKEHYFSKDDMELINSFANQATIAVHNARMYMDVQQRNRVLTALQESTLPLMEQLELSEVLQSILVQASQLLNTQHGYIYLVEPDGKAIKLILGLGVFSEYRGKKMKLGEGLAGRIWRTGEPLNIQNYHSWQEHSAQFTNTEFHAVVGVPLTSSSRIIGVLGLAHLDSVRTFNNDDMELLSRFAQLASIAFENARLYTLNQQELADRKMAEEALRNSEERYRSIFQTSGISIWEEDYSSIKTALNELRLQGVTDFRSYFKEHPEFVRESLGMLKIVDVNAMTIKLYGAKDKMELLSSMDKVFGPEVIGPFTEELVALAEGKSYIEGETVDRNLQGESLYLWKTIVFPKDKSRYRNALVCLTDLTARKKAEDALDESRAQMSGIIESAMDAIISINEDQKVILFNTAAEKMFGSPLSETIGQPLDRFIPNRFLDAHRGHIRRFEQSGITSRNMNMQTDLLGLRSDGSEFPIEVSISQISVGGKKILTAIVRDITERKKAEKLQVAINHVAQAVLTTDSLAELFPQIHKALEGILPVTSFYIALYDREKDVISFPYFVDQYDEPPPPQKPGRGLTEYVLRTQKPLLATRSVLDELVQKGEVDLIGGDSYEWLGVPLILKGDTLGVMVVQTYEEEVHFDQRDVNILTYVSTQVANAIERKRAEDNIRTAETRYRTLVEQIPAIVYMASPEQYIGETYVSPQIEQLGFTQEEWISDPERWLKQLHPDDRERILFEIEEAKEEHEVFQSEYRLFKRDGQIIWVHDETLHVLDENGGPVLLHGIMLDITERKAAEERIKRQLDQLQALRMIDMTIAASTDLRLSLQTILKHTISQLEVDAADVLLLNSATHNLMYQEGIGFLTRGIEQSSVRAGEGFAGQVVQERRTITVKNIMSKTVQFPRKDLIRGEKFECYCGVPLIVKGQVKGVLEIFHRKPLNTDQEWINFLEALAGQTALAIDNATLFEGLRRSNIELVRAYESTLEGWSAALDLRDKETEGHTQRVTALAMQLAETMGISEKDQAHLRRGALLHDIGKMGVPDRILLKPDKLTDDEWEIMRQHPVFARDLLASIEYLRPAMDIPYCHHEKWNGTGYPNGLKGEEIPIAARIFAVTDIYDALTSDRPYRPAWTKKKALEYIESLSGTHHDPKIVAAFLSMMGNY